MMFGGSEKALRGFVETEEFRGILADRIVDVLRKQDVTVALGDRIDNLFSSSVVLHKVFSSIDKTLEYQGKEYIEARLPAIFEQDGVTSKLTQKISLFVNASVEELGAKAFERHMANPSSQVWIRDAVMDAVKSTFQQDAVTKQVTACVENVIEHETSLALAAAVELQVNTTAVSETIQARVEDIINNHIDLQLPALVQYERMDGSVSPPLLPHKQFDDVRKAASIPGSNVLMVGPAGSGKTQIAVDVAKALGLTFYFNGPVQSEYKLLGFRDATGNYSPTPFYNAFTSGGVYLFDEIDASSPQALVAFNTAIANRMCDFPKDGEPVDASDSFHCLAAANTFGRGANHDYVGRNQLDAATLDRFIVIEIDYDREMEFRLARNDKWVTKVQKWRERARELSVRHVISMRASIVGAQLLKNFSEQAVEDMVVWRGLDRNTVSKIKAV